MSGTLPHIRKLDENIGFFIRHGQVVVSIASVIKELLENSLDAGSNEIEIRVKNYGYDTIEIQDNGKGIGSDDFEKVAMKNCTSKISKIDDLKFIKTFGFRGEALSAINAVSELRCITRHELSEDLGSDITFDTNGVPTRVLPVAHPVGTTFVVKNIFYNIPVRRKELERNLRNEFNKAVNVVEAMAILFPSCKFVLSNISSGTSAKKTVVLNLQKCEGLLDRLKSMFNQKVEDLIEIKNVSIKNGSEGVDHESKLNDLTYSNESEFYDLGEKNASVNNFSLEESISVSGYISGVNYRGCSSKKHNQFVYINKRWCINQKINKTINKVYCDLACLSKVPFFVIFIDLPQDMIDVNVSTHKDIILVNKEKNVLKLLKHTILQNLSNSNVIQTSNKGNTSILNSSSSSSSSSLSFLDISMNNSLNSSILNRSLSKYYISKDNCSFNTIQTNAVPQIDNKFGLEPSLEFERLPIPSLCSIDENNVKISTEMYSTPINELNVSRKTISILPETFTPLEIIDEFPKKHKATDAIYPKVKLLDENIINVDDCCFREAIIKTNRKLNSFDFETSYEDAALKRNTIPLICDTNANFNQECFINVIDDMDYHNISKNVDNLLETSRDKLKKRNKNLNKLPETKIDEVVCNINELNFTKHFHKQNFKNCEIIGQFNCGFIIARHENSLYIIDQHAADEKHNFENLKKSMVISGQRLMKPILLRSISPFQSEQLTFANDLLRNINLTLEFCQNENTFMITSMPVFNGKFLFDKNEVLELLDYILLNSGKVFDDFFRIDTVASPSKESFHLQHESKSIIKKKLSSEIDMINSKIHSMVATKACRSSIMIGRHLTVQKMKLIISNLSELDQPWNCPHGRPTMRHLIDL